MSLWRESKLILLENNSRWKAIHREAMRSTWKPRLKI